MLAIHPSAKAAYQADPIREQILAGIRQAAQSMQKSSAKATSLDDLTTKWENLTPRMREIYNRTQRNTANSSANGLRNILQSQIENLKKYRKDIYGF